MKILWLAWKDFKHPAAGGAEVVMRELVRRQVTDGHDVTVLTARYSDAPAQEVVDGVTFIRIGSNRYVHPFLAFWYYVLNLRGKFDIIIETVNTAPYFSLFFRGRARAFALYHQLAREVWFFETKPPLAYLGYHVLEPLATRTLSRAKAALITISESTKRDLSHFGWDRRRAHVISEGIEIEPVTALSALEKFDKPTMLSFGAMRGMKRAIDQIKAFEVAKRLLPDLQLKVAGNATSEYGMRVLKYIKQSPYASSIEFLGRVSRKEKVELMRRCHLITVTSVKEGWGLIVSEAASQGTPAVVYDVDGLRDSVRHEETGLVVPPNAGSLALGIVLMFSAPDMYTRMQRAAWEWSKELTFDKTYEDFKHITEAYV